METAGAGVVGAVNDMYFELALAEDRDQLHGKDAVSRNIPRVTTDGEVDTIIPPIHFDIAPNKPTVSPWEISATWDEENELTALSAKGRIHPPSTKRTNQECQKWVYDLSINGDESQYTVTRLAFNGQEYVFTTRKPELVSRMSEILVGKTTSKITAWGSRFAND